MNIYKMLHAGHAYGECIKILFKKMLRCWPGFMFILDHLYLHFYVNPCHAE